MAKNIILGYVIKDKAKIYFKIYNSQGVHKKKIKGESWLGRKQLDKKLRKDFEDQTMPQDTFFAPKNQPNINTK